MPGFKILPNDEIDSVLKVPLYVVCNYILRFAAECGNIDILNLVLGSGIAGIDASTGDDYALRCASSNGYTNIVEILLKQDLVDATSFNYHAFEEAAYGGHLEVVKLLLGSVKADDLTVGASQALVAGAAKGRIAIVKYLLDRPDLNVAHCLNSAITNACRNGELEMVKLVLGLDGVDPSDNNNVAIRSASGNGCTDIVKLLAEIPGVDASACNNEAVRNASARGHVDTVRILLSTRRVDAAALDNEAIRNASRWGHDGVVKLLLSVPGVDATGITIYVLVSKLLVNTVTDPDVGFGFTSVPVGLSSYPVKRGWTFGTPVEGVDNEVTSVCEGQRGSITSDDGSVVAVQKYWSNRDNACVLLIQLEEARQSCTERDEKINEILSQKEQIKVKLHDSYKEFLALNETILQLKKEAEHGSDAIISRNEVLQRNLDRLARDFEVSTRDLGTAQTRIKELEFELEEMVVQFNITGEAKRSAEDLNVKLTSELDHLTTEHKSLKQAHEISVSTVKRLEYELASVIDMASSTTLDLETKNHLLTKEVADLTVAKKEVDGQLKTARSEVKNLSSALKSLTRSKDQLEAAFRTTSQKHQKEVEKLEEKIKELQNLRVEDEKVLKKTQELKEQLMFQVTDLQNNLDRELANVNVLSFDLAQLKRTTEEKTAQIENMLRTELADLHQHHNELTEAHESLEKKQAYVQETNVELTMQQEALMKRYAALEAKEADGQTEIRRLEEENVQLCTAAFMQRNEMKINLDSIYTLHAKKKTSLSKKLKRTLDATEIELKDTKAALEAETLNKEQFEVRLYEIRRDLLSEKKNRLDLERMHDRIDRHAAARHLERLATMRERDRKLLEVSKSLHGEYSRLKDISGMLPNADQFSVIDSPDIPDFFPDGTHHNTGGRSDRPPDVK
ncbi:hypothetical protein HDU76_013287, partial [Blyttiomyces sp. JEL0837]